MATDKYTSNDLERFWSKVAITANPDKCWEWQASLKPSGYGQFNLRNKIVYAHRFSWEYTNGEIADGLFVCHECDNRLCVNPAHLFLGTQKQNIENMLSKGRQAPTIATVHYGEAHGGHKLTANQVNYIRERFANGDVLQCELASEVGVSRTTVSRIIKGRSWKHQ